MIPNKSPENSSNPPQQFPVPLRDPVPDSPNVFPTFKAGPVEEGLVDPVCVVYICPGFIIVLIYQKHIYEIFFTSHRCEPSAARQLLPCKPRREEEYERTCCNLGTSKPRTSRPTINRIMEENLNHLEVGEVVEEDFWLEGKLHPPLVAFLPPFWSDAVHGVAIDPIHTKQLHLY